VSSAVAGLGGNFRAMEGYLSTAGPYFLKRLAPADTVNGGEGLWILVGSAADWVIPFVP
jgi:hypothetical protein